MPSTRLSPDALNKLPLPFEVKSQSNQPRNAQGLVACGFYDAVFFILASVDFVPLIWHINSVTVIRTHVLMPEDLVREIDALVGPRGRSAFLVETARNEVRRKKQLDFLNSDQPAWKDENHPELAEGAAAWVRKLRAESERATKRRLKGKV